jgi:predicted nucleotidyltransferase
MDREAIIARLREKKADLRAQGVAHAALFGSRARGDAPTANWPVKQARDVLL